MYNKSEENRILNLHVYHRESIPLKSFSNLLHLASVVVVDHGLQENPNPRPHVFNFTYFIMHLF